MSSDRIYRDMAKYYDLIYSWKKYRKETITVKALIRKYKKSTGKDLLDIACGTGRHLEYLSKDFRCMGTDYNKQMLLIAKKRLPHVPFVQADMVKLTLEKKFDVITCLFSAIGHAKTYANLQKAIEGFAAHLKPGGVVLIEPFFTTKTYNAGVPGITVYEDDDLKIARLQVSERKGELAIMDMHFLIAERDKKTTHFVDRLEVGLFDHAKFLKIMRDCGLKSVFLKNGLMKGRGLFVGVSAAEEK